MFAKVRESAEAEGGIEEGGKQMKTVVRLGLGLIAAALPMLAAPPSCETTHKGEGADEITFETCQRDDFCDDATIKEQVQNPSTLWMGCMWPALITTSSNMLHIGPDLPGILMVRTDLTLVARFRDSERMDVTVTFELPDHTFRKDTYRDVLITIRHNIPQATILIATQASSRTIGVPTIEATERGGKKNALHIYR